GAHTLAYKHFLAADQLRPTTMRCKRHAHLAISGILSIFERRGAGGAHLIPPPRCTSRGQWHPAGGDVRLRCGSSRTANGPWLVGRTRGDDRLRVLLPDEMLSRVRPGRADSLADADLLPRAGSVFRVRHAHRPLCG